MVSGIRLARALLWLGHAAALWSLGLSDSHGPQTPLQYPTLPSVEVPPDHMKLHTLHQSGPWGERMDLTFFADGYTAEQELDFLQDAGRLVSDILAPGGAMSEVSGLLNVYAVFVPSYQSGIGLHSKPLLGASFGLYRPEGELRAVFVHDEKKARGACEYWRHQGQVGRAGGCDQPILLGNDPLYGGLGGEFTIITASKLNGPLVLRHELGHSLIDVGEEYEGGYAYFGVNSDLPTDLSKLKWADQLSLPADSKPRIEDARTSLQAYPWHDLSHSSWSTTFTLQPPTTYPTALFAASLSSIPHASHIDIRIDGTPVDLQNAFPRGSWEGSKDRRWLVLPLAFDFEGHHANHARNVTVQVALTEKGAKERAGRGGKVLSSIELIQYGTPDRFNATEGHVSAFPTFAEDGSMTLRPTNEGCLMRRVNYPSFCTVCKRGLKNALHRKIAHKTAPRP